MKPLYAGHVPFHTAAGLIDAADQPSTERRQAFFSRRLLLQRPARQRPPQSSAAAGDLSSSNELSLDAAADPVGSLQSTAGPLVSVLRAFYKFTRPHTMLGTFISVTSISLLALVRVLSAGARHVATCRLGWCIASISCALLISVLSPVPFIQGHLRMHFGRPASPIASLLYLGTCGCAQLPGRPLVVHGARHATK